MKDIKGKTRYTFTNTQTNEVITGLFQFEDEDGIFIRTDNCPAEYPGADCGFHPFGIIDGTWKYTRQ